MGQHLKKYSNKYTGDNTDVKTLENLIPTILTDQDRLALRMVAEGKNELEIAEFLEISPKEVQIILSKPQVEGVLQEYYEKVLKFRLAPKALKAIEQVIDQDRHMPAKLTASLKVLSSINVLKKDGVPSNIPQVGVYVQTNITDNSNPGNIKREQIAIMRQNLVERRSQIYEKSTNTGSGSSNRAGPDQQTD